MIPGPIVEFFSAHQDLLWLTTLVLDLSLTLLMYRLFGRIGLIAAFDTPFSYWARTCDVPGVLSDQSRSTAGATEPGYSTR